MTDFEVTVTIHGHESDSPVGESIRDDLSLCGWGDPKTTKETPTGCELVYVLQRTDVGIIWAGGPKGDNPDPT